MPCLHGRPARWARALYRGGAAGIPGTVPARSRAVPDSARWSSDSKAAISDQRSEGTTPDQAAAIWQAGVEATRTLAHAYLAGRLAWPPARSGHPLPQTVAFLPKAVVPPCVRLSRKCAGAVVFRLESIPGDLQAVQLEGLDGHGRRLRPQRFRRNFGPLTGAWFRVDVDRPAEWQHIDFEIGRLTLPETKTGRRVHDLPAPALAVLAELPRFSTWAFTSTGTAAITYRTVRKHFVEIATAAGIKDVRLHDLRRTVMTRAAASGVGTHILRDLPGHKTTARADRYIRAVGDPVREAREQVGAEMAAMMDGEGG